MIYYNNKEINDWNFGDDNIAKVYKHGVVCHYKIEPPAHDYSQDYFTVVSQSAGTSVQISGSSSEMKFQVSTNGGTSWLSAARVVAVSSLSKGAKVLIMSSTTLSPSSSTRGVGKISITGACSVEGNVMSLMYGSSFKGKTTMQGTYCFYDLFNGCGENLLSVKNLVLPATTLEDNCYGRMFYGCSKIEKAPVLPATELTTRCYGSMFAGCSSLSYIKAMFITKPSTSYTNSWVYGVKSSGTFVKNSSATWDVIGNYAVPDGWTVQTESS